MQIPIGVRLASTKPAFFLPTQIFSNLKIEKIAECLGHTAAIYALAEAPTAGNFYSAGGDGLLVEWQIGQPDLGKAVANVGEQIFSIASQIHSSSLIPHPSKQFVGTMNGGIFQVVPNQPEQTRNIRHHAQKPVFGLQWIENQLISIGGDGFLTRWDAEKLLPSESFKLSNHALRSLAFSESRGELAVGSSDGSLFLMDSESLFLKKTLPAAHGSSIFSLAFSPDENFLLSGGRDAMLRRWDLNSDFQKTHELPAHRFTVNDLRFSPDGQLLATASRDRTVKIWDSENLKLLKVVDSVRSGGHLNSVNRLLWLDGFLISSSDDRSLKIWRIQI